MADSGVAGVADVSVSSGTSGADEHERDVATMHGFRGRWWEAMTSPGLGALAGVGTVALIPVGATEQHGPHLPTGTDTIVASALCARVSLLAPAVVLPPIPIGASFFHGRELAGTLAVSGVALAQHVGVYADWCASSGIRRMLFVNGHVGNTAALGVATDELRAVRRDLRVGFVNWWTLSADIAREVTADCEDWHANCAETAMMLALAPQLVDRTRFADADDADRSEGLVFRYLAGDVSRNGVTGQPSAATTELGEQLVEWCTIALADVVRRAAVEEPPLPAR